MKIQSKNKTSAEIPNASIADIVFLLLIFFMTVTVFKQHQGLRVEIPAAKATKKLEKRRAITHIWIDSENKINLDDMMITTAEIMPIMKKKMNEDPAIIVSVRADKKAKYRYVAETLEKLKAANALRVNFATNTEKMEGIE